MLIISLLGVDGVVSPVSETCDVSFEEYVLLGEDAIHKTHPELVHLSNDCVFHLSTLRPTILHVELWYHQFP